MLGWLHCTGLNGETGMSDSDDAIARTAAAVALQQSEARLRLMIDAVPAMITYLDTAERFLFCNRPYLEMLGRRADEVLGHDLLDVLGAELYARIEPAVAQVQAGVTAHYERQHTRADGALRDLSVTFVPHIEAGHVVGFFCLTLDVSEVKTLQRKLAHQASHDVLTGLPNRMLYIDHLTQAIERCRRHAQPFALAFLDIDHFKQVNDIHGHAVGDQLLRAFAQRLRGCVRGCDIAARLGGDEFALILDGPIAPAHAAGLGAKIVHAMREPFELAGVTLRVTTSIGITVAGDATLPAAVLETRADAALYRAKARGRDTCEHDPD